LIVVSDAAFVTAIAAPGVTLPRPRATVLESKGPKGGAGDAIGVRL